MCFSFLMGAWRTRLLWIFLLLLAVFVFFLEFCIETGGSAEPIVEPAIQLPDRDLLTQEQVVSVIDGDTIEVEVDGKTERVRYYGSDAPERGEPCGDEALERNGHLVAQQIVFLLPDARDKDSQGRLLRYVFTSDGRLLDEILIREGLAKAWRQDGAYRDQLVTLEERAALSRVGCLWEK